MTGRRSAFALGALGAVAADNVEEDAGHHQDADDDIAVGHRDLGEGQAGLKDGPHRRAGDDSRPLPPRVDTPPMTAAATAYIS